MLKTDPETMRKTKKIQAAKISEKLDLISSQGKDLHDDKDNKHSQVKRKREEKKNICVVGESMLKNITG